MAMARRRRYHPFSPSTLASIEANVWVSNETRHLHKGTTSAPLSAFELRTKLKSRTSAWEAAGVPAKDTKGIDNNLTVCSAINAAAYNWVSELFFKI